MADATLLSLPSSSTTKDNKDRLAARGRPFSAEFSNSTDDGEAADSGAVVIFHSIQDNPDLRFGLILPSEFRSHRFGLPLGIWMLRCAWQTASPGGKAIPFSLSLYGYMLMPTSVYHNYGGSPILR